MGLFRKKNKKPPVKLNFEDQRLHAAVNIKRIRAGLPRVSPEKFVRNRQKHLEFLKEK